MTQNILQIRKDPEYFAMSARCRVFGMVAYNIFNTFTNSMAQFVIFLPQYLTYDITLQNMIFFISLGLSRFFNNTERFFEVGLTTVVKYEKNMIF